ncbi:MAG: hypothetical protein R3B94_08975 [Hyphomonas sp.]
MKLSLKPMLICASVALASLSPTAQAQEMAVFGPPTASYEAQRTILTNDMSLIQSVHSKPGKNRSEMTVEGQQLIQIWRDDLKTLYSLSPQQGMAMAIPYGSDQAQSALAEFDQETTVLEKRFIGSEIVNGVRTDHYYLKTTTSGGGVSTGDVWTTPENIAVRIRMKLTTPGDPTQDVSIDLVGLTLAEQPDALFEVPEGYQTLTMGNQPSILGSVSGYTGDIANDAADAAAREADQQVRGKANEEASKLVRKIFKW